MAILKCDSASLQEFDIAQAVVLALPLLRPSFACFNNETGDCGGGDADRPFKRATAFRALGYRAAVVRDDDKKPTAGVEAAFTADGGKVVAWRDGRTLEDELFLSMTDDGVGKLIDRAVELHGEESGQRAHQVGVAKRERPECRPNWIANQRYHAGEPAEYLGKAARTKKAGWFKSVTWMEDVARDIVGPDLANADAGFRALVDAIFAWAGNARE